MERVSWVGGKSVLGEGEGREGGRTESVVVV